MRIKRESPCLGLRFMPIKLPSEQHSFIYTLSDVICGWVYACAQNAHLCLIIFLPQLHKEQKNLPKRIKRTSGRLNIAKENCEREKYFLSFQYFQSVSVSSVSHRQHIRTVMKCIYTQTHCIYTAARVGQSEKAPLLPLARAKRKIKKFSSTRTRFLPYTKFS